MLKIWNILAWRVVKAHIIMAVIMCLIGVTAPETRADCLIEKQRFDHVIQRHCNGNLAVASQFAPLWCQNENTLMRVCNRIITNEIGFPTNPVHLDMDNGQERWIGQMSAVVGMTGQNNPVETYCASIVGVETVENNVSVWTMYPDRCPQ